MAHARQSGPDSGHGFQVKVLTTFSVVATALASHVHEGGPQHVMIPPAGNLKGGSCADPEGASFDFVYFP